MECGILDTTPTARRHSAAFSTGSASQSLQHTQLCLRFEIRIVGILDLYLEHEKKMEETAVRTMRYKHTMVDIGDRASGQVMQSI